MQANHCSLSPPRRPVQTVAPTVEPLSVDEVKRQLRIAAEISYDDEWITSAIIAARQQWEGDTSIVCCTSTWAEAFDGWPDVIEFQRRPASAVTGINYLDSAGATTTLSTSYYTFDANRDRPAVFWKPLTSLPSLSVASNVNLVTVTYTAGYGAAAAVPQRIKQALLLLVSEWFEERQATPSRRGEWMLGYERIVAHFMRSTYP